VNKTCAFAVHVIPEPCVAETLVSLGMILSVKRKSGRGLPQSRHRFLQDP